MESLITQMRRRDGKEGRLRSARTCAYEKQTEFSEEKESVFIDKKWKACERNHIKRAHHDLVKGVTAQKTTMTSRFDSSRYPRIIIVKTRNTRGCTNWDRWHGRRDMARTNTVCPTLVSIVKDRLRGYCEDKSGSKTCKAFRVFIQCNEVGTDLMCMTGTGNTPTEPDLPNSDVPLQSTDSLNLTLNAHQPND